MFSSNELIITHDSRLTKAKSFQIEGETSDIVHNSDTLRYDWSKVIGFVRELIQIISMLCISINVETVGFESFLLMYHKNCSYFAFTIQLAIFWGKCQPYFVGQIRILFMPTPSIRKPHTALHSLDIGSLLISTEKGLV